ncbi:hypothetical protein [Hymenobacter terrenus]|uniref:hypothetical protein n=1 Tax=Hymenobacter terrenus TaxID=1629124 RepID=UPI000A77E910|nr:hypothetical protein [Hymenobacter terrenus]
MRTLHFAFSLILVFFLISRPALAQRLDRSGRVDLYTPPTCLYRPGNTSPSISANEAQIQRIEVIDALTSYLYSQTSAPTQTPLIRNVLVETDRASAQVETRFKSSRITHYMQLRLQYGQWQVVGIRSDSREHR